MSTTPSDLQRLSWLDAEITRYRDYEWRLTSFYSVFLAAIFYVFVDQDRRDAVDFVPEAFIVVVIWLYALWGVFSLGYAHVRLNQRRGERRELCDRIGEPTRDSILRGPLRFWEGWGIHVITGLILSILAFAAIDTALVVREPDSASETNPGDTSLIDDFGSTP